MTEKEAYSERLFLLCGYITPNIEEAKELIRKGANVNYGKGQRDCPLYLAFKNKHLDIAKLLLDNGANPNKELLFMGTFLMRFSVEPDVIKMLLEYNADVNAKTEDGQTPLHYACHNFVGYTELPLEDGLESLELLIKAGADINAQDKRGNTALLDMIDARVPVTPERELKMLDAIKLLVANGNDVNIQDNKKETALFKTVFKESPIISKYLIEHTDMRILDIEKSNILRTLALSKKMGYLVKLAIEKGADINNKSKDGITPLMDAIQYGNVEAVETLLHFDADTNITYFNGDTLLTSARHHKEYYTEKEPNNPEIKKYAEIIELLEKHEQEKILNKAILKLDGNEGFSI